MTYAEKLLLPEWRHKRYQVIFNHGFTCDDCGFKSDQLSSFQVHHSYYLRTYEPWQYDDDCYMCLCPECHLTRQAWEDTAKVMLGQLCHLLTVDEVNDLTTDLMEKAAKLKTERDNRVCEDF